MKAKKREMEQAAASRMADAAAERKVAKDAAKKLADNLPDKVFARELKAGKVHEDRGDFEEALECFQLADNAATELGDKADKFLVAKVPALKESLANITSWIDEEATC